MYRILKILHLLGLTLFLGSVLGHIVAGIGAGDPGSASFLFAREEIALATRALTLPGLLLAILSGIAMARLGRLSPVRQRWLAAKALLTAVVAVNALLFVVPSGDRALAGARALLHGEAGATAAGVLSAVGVESVAGAVNILLVLAIVALGVAKPRLASPSAPRRDNGVPRTGPSQP